MTKNKKISLEFKKLEFEICLYFDTWNLGFNGTI